jgi:hypothetical protein
MTLRGDIRATLVSGPDLMGCRLQMRILRIVRGGFIRVSRRLGTPVKDADEPGGGGER